MSLPPKVQGELFYDGQWNPAPLRSTSPVTITRGLSSESMGAAAPTACECLLDNRDLKYSPRNPYSPLYGKVGRNTPFRLSVVEGDYVLRLDRGGYDVFEFGGSSALNITGDIDLRMDLRPDRWSSRQILVSRTLNDAAFHWAWGIDASGYMMLWWSQENAGFAPTVAKATVPFSEDMRQRKTVRATLDVNNGAGGWTVRFYTASSMAPSSWTQIGADVTGAGTTALFPRTCPTRIGDRSGVGLDFPGFSEDTPNPVIGEVYGFQMRNGINGTLVMNMDMASSILSPDGLTYGDATGFFWQTDGASARTNERIRAVGEVSSWALSRDMSGNDSSVSITPTGVMRRMDAGNKPVDSALLRFIKRNGATEVWPLTDAERSATAVSALQGQPLRIGRTGTYTPPDFTKGDLGDALEPVMSVAPNTSGVMFGTLPYAPARYDWAVDFFLSGGGPKGTTTLVLRDLGKGTDADPVNTYTVVIDATTKAATGTLAIQGETTSSSSDLLSGPRPIEVFDERPHHVRIGVEWLGSSSGNQVYMYVDGVLAVRNNIPINVTRGLGAVELRWGFQTPADTNMTARSFGYLTYWTKNDPVVDFPDEVQVYEAFQGYPGETAADRVVRTATDAGFYAEAYSGEGSQAMGPQKRKPLLESLNECRDADFGYLVDFRDLLGVYLRNGSTLWNQEPVLTLDFSQGVISAPFVPVDDDKLTENDVSVKLDGSEASAQRVQEDGPMSVQDFPDGVGRYDSSYTLNLQSADQADNAASLLLHLGTHDGVRYSRITLNLGNPRVFEMYSDIYAADVGDKIRLVNIPPEHGIGPIDVLINGYVEEIADDKWTITFNCTPAEPWVAGVVEDGSHDRVDTDGSVLAATVDSTATSMDVYTTTEPRWVEYADSPSDFPFFIRLGDEVATVTSVKPPVHDDFERSVASGWGTSTTGQAWGAFGGVPADRSVSGGVGRLNITAKNSNRWEVAGGSATGDVFTDVDVQVDIATSALAVGGQQYLGLMARASTLSDYYYGRLAFNTNQTLTLVIQKVVGGGQLDMVTVSVPGVHAAGTFFTLRFKVEGSLLRAKVWKRGDPEPGFWAAQVTDTGLTGPGVLGLRTILDSQNTNTLPVTAMYENFRVLNPQEFSVTRSINGVQKSQTAGTDVRLANPSYVAL